LRRSRGYVPEPLTLTTGFPRPVLACGAELKNTFCLARGCHAFVSHHIGDLENAETLRSFTEGIEHFRRLFDIDPDVVAHGRPPRPPAGSRGGWPPPTWQTPTSPGAIKTTGPRSWPWPPRASTPR